MAIFQYNDRVTLEYVHKPIYASANPITGARYVTTLWIHNDNGSKYELGEFNGKMDEDAVKINFEDMIRERHNAQYGQQTTVLRKELKPRRDRGKVGSISQQLGHTNLSGRSILDT